MKLKTYLKRFYQHNYLGPLLVCLALLGSPPAAYGADSLIELDGHQFHVTTAVTKEEKAKGLMHVKHLPQDEGMLFIYAEPHQLSFWMKNTKIALDILFFDEDGKLVKVHHNAQPCITLPCPRYESEQAASYVLEVNGGLTQKFGIKNQSQFHILPE